MAGPHQPFPMATQAAALARQNNKCGSCGCTIHALGMAGATAHDHGESAEGHHVIPHQLGGPLSVDNCVVLCKSCHYSVHRGGHYAYTAQYDSVKSLPMPRKIAQIANLYPHYR